MKKYIFILVAGILIVSSCKGNQAATEAASTESAISEPPRKGPPQRGGRSLEERLAKQEEMYTKLGLSDDQKVKFRAIEAAYADKMKSSKDEGREAMKTMMDAKLAEIKGILTPAQFIQHQEMLTEMRKQRGGRGR